MDGNGGTRWESAINTDPSWISIDLANQYALTNVVIDWEAANAATYQIQGSTNGTAWVTLATKTGGAFGNRTDTVSVTGNYRYVRIYGTARSSQYGYSIWSLKIYGGAVVASSSSTASSNPVTTNLALGRTTAASTAVQTAANAVDGNGGTRWESAANADPSWISVDLGTAKILSSVVIDWEAANAANYQVQGSNDNTNWTSLATRTGGAFGNRTDTNAVSGSYRYVRIYGTARSTGNQWGYSIYELKVYGSGGAVSSTSSVVSSTPVVTSSSKSSASSSPVVSSAASSTSSVALGNIVPLYNNATALEPESVVEFADRVETTFSDRSRDRHAREVRTEPVPAFTDETGFLRNMEQGSGYDHYLPHYWLDRTVTVIIKDYIAKGGTYIDIEMYSQVPMESTGTRFFYYGVGTVAEYMNNTGVTLVPGEPNHFKLSLTQNNPVLRDYWKRTNNLPQRPLKVGDRIEMEIAQFLDAGSVHPAGSRNNYYGTALLYLVGGGKGDQPNGIVPWIGKPTLDTDGNGNILKCNLVSNNEPNCPTVLDSFPLPQNAWLGGRTTLPYNYSGEPWQSFKQHAGNMAGGTANVLKVGGSAELFMLGRRLVHTDFQNGVHSELPQNPNNLNDVQTNEPFVAMQGKVGPRFYTTSCVGCHFNNGRSIPKGLGVTINNQAIKIGSNAAGAPHALYGGSLQPFSTTAGSGVGEAQTQLAGYVAAPNYVDGSVNSLTKPRYNFVSGTAPDFFSVRNSPAFVGLGLLDAVPEADIVAIASANNGAGISGRVQRVVDPATGQTRLGRFGWKGASSSLKHQIASALNIEMGVTTTVFPKLDCGTNQTDCQTGNELGNNDLDLMVRYIATLGVPARRNLDNSQAVRGEVVFGETGCNACHKETLKTSAYAPLTEVRSQTIHPYTDLLLHDMGPGLADNLGESEASGAEWRTAPLWGIGFTADVAGGGREAYLHDGRAKTLNDAILWHDGEAANARKAYVARTQSDKDALVKFLKSL
ncbi:MAG: thiol oxidoreductase [Sphingobacteriales bacterium]|nr:MAG: thiol oxidoreductase [Sphingobacteriales bacterium]